MVAKSRLISMSTQPSSADLRTSLYFQTYRVSQSDRSGIIKTAYILVNKLLAKIAPDFEKVLVTMISFING